MILEINNKEYPVTIIKKPNKNMYLRIKEDLTITVTAPLTISNQKIEKFIKENYSYIEKVITKKELLKKQKENKLLILGKSYEICYINQKKVELGQTHAFIGKTLNIDNWYKKCAQEIFKEKYMKCYENFKQKEKMPELKIRKMKGKWGVCNIKSYTITINLELIKYEEKYLEYVIYHELSHLREQNHSKNFWNEVEKYCPNYKTIRKEMKNL